MERKLRNHQKDLATLAITNCWKKLVAAGVPIYEVGERDGQCYFSMKFVEGGQLDEVVKREPMPIRRAVEFIVKVARTVHYAHEHGILHRDIKPGNILLDAKGKPHLTDFGLARLVESESSVTQTLDVLGTPSYMAPEQALGNNAAVSSVTDVYGLGAVLYQLLTGQPPFAGGTTYETIKLLLDSEPRQPRSLNPKIDRELSTICLKCLEKDPKRRYCSALALAEDLEHWLKHEPIRAKPSGFFTHGRKWVRRNPSTTVLATSLVVFAIGFGVVVWSRKPAVVIRKSVAVLPFENLSDDPNNAYFADGIQEEILTRLAKITDLKVISRSSTQRYHSKPGNLAEIAKQLGVANIVEGSVQKAADQVRVNVQLINAQSDSHLWADSYDRKLTDILGAESEIAKRIAQSLQAELTGLEEQALAVKPTNNPEAYDAYLRGLAFDTASLTSTNRGKSTDSYERAVQLDPNFAVAWARLSRAKGIAYADNNEPTQRDAAKSALDNARKLEPNSPETLLALGNYQYLVLLDYAAAKTTFKRVSEMLPGSSEVSYALGRVARREGHWDEGVTYFEQALSLDPRNTELLTNAAYTYVSLRRFPAALKLLDRVLDSAPNDLGATAIKVGSTDFWHIDLRSIASGVGAQFIIDFENSFPGLVIRNPTTGAITEVLDPSLNLTGAIVEGSDYEAIYILDSSIFGHGDFGRLTFTLNGTYLSRFEFQATPFSKRIGLSGGFVSSASFNGSLPHNRAYASLFYDGPADTWLAGFDAGATVHYTGQYEDLNGFLTQSLKPQEPRSGPLPWRARKVSEWATLDLIASYTFNLPPPAAAAVPGLAKDGSKNIKMKDGNEKNVLPVSTAEYNPCGWRSWLNNMTLTLGMQNVLDSDPPFVAGGFGNNYDNSLATIKGRFWYVQLKKRF